MIYSYDERKIGNAFGENLYQRSFLLTRADDLVDNSYTFPDSVRNIVSFEGFVTDNNNPVAIATTADSCVKKPIIQRVSNADFTAANFSDYDAETPENATVSFSFGTGIVETSYPYIFMTIRYTKRTT